MINPGIGGAFDWLAATVGEPEQRPHEHWRRAQPEKTIDLVLGSSIHRKLETALVNTFEACHSGDRYLRNVVAENERGRTTWGAR